MSDDELVEQIRLGNENAAEELIKRYYTSILRYCKWTRASGAQITLAKLVLAGAANLVCITILLCMEVFLQNSYKEIGQMVLYCLVPYLVCMVALLRLIRLQKKESVQICAIVMLGSCICWGMSARILPWLYETSAMGLWIVTFLIFAVFFLKEIGYIAEMRKEGKMYGIVA